MTDRLKVATSAPYANDPMGVGFVAFRSLYGTEEQIAEYFRVDDLRGVGELVRGWGDDCSIHDSCEEHGRMMFIWKLRLNIDKQWHLLRVNTIEKEFTGEEKQEG